jgi:hypothetical protein
MVRVLLLKAHWLSARTSTAGVEYEYEKESISLTWHCPANRQLVQLFGVCSDDLAGKVLSSHSLAPNRN